MLCCGETRNEAPWRFFLLCALSWTRLLCDLAASLLARQRDSAASAGNVYRAAVGEVPCCDEDCSHQSLSPCASSWFNPNWQQQDNRRLCVQVRSMGRLASAARGPDVADSCAANCSNDSLPC